MLNFWLRLKILLKNHFYVDFLGIKVANKFSFYLISVYNVLLKDGNIMIFFNKNKNIIWIKVNKQLHKDLKVLVKL